jgi:hypothetical protein
MASKKINNLILKSTNYGSGVATNKPLDVKDFEGNFVTLADGINDIDDKFEKITFDIRGDFDKQITDLEDLISSIGGGTASVDLSEVYKSIADLKQSVEGDDKETAILKGRVDALETAVEELGANLPNAEEATVLADEKSLSDATDIQIAIDTYGFSPSRLTEGAYLKVREAVAKEAAQSKEESLFPSEILSKLLDNNFNGTYKMLKDYLSTEPEAIEFTYSSESGEFNVISEGVELGVNSDGSIYNNGSSTIEWSTGWDLSDYGSKSWTTMFSDMFSDIDSEILKTKLVMRSLNNDDSSYTYYRVIVKSKSNIRNNRQFAPALTESNEITQEPYSLTYSVKEIDVDSEKSYSLAKEYLKYLVTTSRVSTKSDNYFFSKNLYDNKELSKTISGVLSFLDSKLDDSDALESSFKYIVGENGIVVNFEVNENGDIHTYSIKTYSELVSAVNLITPLSKIAASLKEKENDGLSTREDIQTWLLSEMLSISLVVPANALAVEDTINYFKAFYNFLQTFNLMQKVSADSDSIGYTVSFNTVSKIKVLSTGTVSQGLLEIVMKNYGMKRPMSLLLSDLVKGSKLSLLTYSDVYMDFIKLTESYKKIHLYLNQAFSLLIKVNPIFSSFILEFGNAILKYAQLVELGIRLVYTLPGFEQEFLDNPHTYDILISKYVKIIDILSKNIPTALDIPAHLEMSKDIESYFDSKLLFLMESAVSEVKTETDIISKLFNSANIVTNSEFDTNISYEDWNRIIDGGNITNSGNNKYMFTDYGLGSYRNCLQNIINETTSQWYQFLNWASSGGWSTIIDLFNSGFENGVLKENPWLGTTYIQKFFTKTYSSKDENELIVWNNPTTESQIELDFKNYVTKSKVDYQLGYTNIDEFLNDKGWGYGLDVWLGASIRRAFGATYSGLVSPYQFWVENLWNSFDPALHGYDYDLNAPGRMIRWVEAVGGTPPDSVGKEMILLDIQDNKYYRVKFLSWTQNEGGGGLSYTRQEIDSTGQTIGELITFSKDNYATDVDVVSQYLTLKRGDIQGLFNSNVASDYPSESKLPYTHLWLSEPHMMRIDTITDTYQYDSNFLTEVQSIIDDCYTISSYFGGEDISLSNSFSSLFNGDNFPTKAGFGITSLLSLYESLKTNFPVTTKNSFAWKAINATYKAICDSLDNSLSLTEPTGEFDIKSYQKIQIGDKWYLLHMSGDDWSNIEPLEKLIKIIEEGASDEQSLTYINSTLSFNRLIWVLTILIRVLSDDVKHVLEVKAQA